MATKRPMGFALMFAAAAFVVMPAASQAESIFKWNVNSVPTATGVHTPVIMWGPISYKFSNSTEITCENAAIGDVYNSSSSSMIGEVEGFATADCESATYCPGESIELVGDKTRFNSGGITGWPMFIHDTSPPRVEFAISLTLRVFCANAEGNKTTFVMGLRPGSPFFAVEPLAPFGIKKGTSAKSPGFFEFDAGSGNLEKFEGPGESLTVKLEGEVKILGYEEQELINRK